jgi:L-arabinokinase
MKNILFYITGHGYGHATRTIEIIKKLINTTGCHCFIKTSAPEWLFKINLQKNYTYSFLLHDIGTIQQDWLHVNKKESLEAFKNLWENRQSIIENELSLIQTHRIDLIFGDIPPLAFEIAAAANLPSLVMGNFSWDWIYQPYLAEFPEYTTMVESIRQAYQKADLLLRLPFYGEMSAFKKIKDVPLVARIAQLPKVKVRQLFSNHVRLQSTLVLIALRQDDLKLIDLNRLKQFKNFTFLFFNKDYAIHENFLQIPQDFIPFQEIVQTADIVVSKLGYGIVSECFANQTPLLFTNRFDFREYEVLKKGLTEQGRGLYVPLADFLAGNWESYIQEMLNYPVINSSIPINGAEVVVKTIREFL